jgi:hypothetical protein
MAAATFAVVGVTGAFAAGGSTVGSDVSIVSACTHDGVRTDYVLAGQQITAVVVDGLTASCVGETVSVSLGEVGGGSVEVSATVDGTPMTLTLGAPMDIEDLSTVSVAVTD